MYRIRFTTLTLLIAILALSGWLPPHSAEIRQHEVQDSKTVILVRHAEKCTELASDPGLTTLGQERAQALRRTLVDLSIEVIYSTPYERTLQTVQVLAEDHGVDIIQTPVSAGFLQRLAETIISSAHSVMVVSGHSNTTTRMVNLLAGTDYPDLDESEYDRLFIVHLPESGAPIVTTLRYGPLSGPPASPC